MVDNRFESHPLTEEQLFGGDSVEHAGVSYLSNEQLMMPGGPNGDDPIIGSGRGHNGGHGGLLGAEKGVRIVSGIEGDLAISA